MSLTHSLWPISLLNLWPEIKRADHSREIGHSREHPDLTIFLHNLAFSMVKINSSTPFTSESYETKSFVSNCSKDVILYFPRTISIGSADRSSAPASNITKVAFKNRKNGNTKFFHFMNLNTKKASWRTNQMMFFTELHMNLTFKLPRIFRQNLCQLKNDAWCFVESGRVITWNNNLVNNNLVVA